MTEQTRPPLGGLSLGGSARPGGRPGAAAARPAGRRGLAAAARRRPSGRRAQVGFHLRRRPLHALAALVLTTIVALAIVGPLLPLPDPDAQDLLGRLEGPMTRGRAGQLHLAGTDHLGRDVLSRVVLGSRATLGVALTTVLVAGAFGTLLGLLAGYRRGAVDQAIMRLVDLQMAFPSMLFAIFLLYLMGANLFNLVLLLAIIGWTSVARIVRAQTFALRNQVFVESARAIGCSHVRILWRHILPHLVPVLAVIVVFDFSGVMLAEAGLSFLGLGVQPPDTSWGRMIAEGQRFIPAGAWWLFLIPGGAIFLTVLSSRLVSSWIQEIVGRTVDAG